MACIYEVLLHPVTRAGYVLMSWYDFVLVAGSIVMVVLAATLVGPGVAL